MVLLAARISSIKSSGTSTFPAYLSVSASSIILCHNHPSGNIYPSDADENITQKVSGAAEVMDIKVLDHLIIAAEKYLSFADEGKL